MNTPPGTIDIFLQPGDFYFGDASTRIRTVLGSCVSITMWHPKRFIGGMCHFMLPSRPQRDDTLQGKYADEALELFIQQIKQFKTQPADYQIKLFGGGDMFPTYSNRVKNSVSQKNIEAAEALLAQHNLLVSARDLGGVGHRNLFFELWSGHVWVMQKPLTETRLGVKKN